ncbi:MAG: PIN domain-containing protein, partial [Bacteroidota bacterium]|nr:PIN domain-containing protein [Bacteroidota bacterium]
MKKNAAGKKIIKSFVLDTNVILHDSSCISQFQEHNIVIPLTVIEELDHFKRGNQVINLNAREFARTLDQMTGDGLFNGGIPLGKGKGKIRVGISKGLSNEIKNFFKEDTPDHRILSLAQEMTLKDTSSTQTILVTKDVNLRMKAKAIGVLAEDYSTDRIISLEELYSGKEIIDNFDDDLLLKFFQAPYEVSAKSMVKYLHDEILPNKYYILKNESRSVLVSLDMEKTTFKKIDKLPAYGIKPRNAEQTFAIDALTNPNIPLVSLTGKAGTGKTILALAAALHHRKEYRQIYIARPIVPLSNKDIGFLPGDVHSKLEPYMQPLYDNLKVIQDQFAEHDKQFIQINTMIKDEKLVIEPLSYIRGRSLQR